MSLLVPPNPHPFHVASHADRLAREHQGHKIALVFSAVTAISLGVMTTKMVLEMFKGNKEQKRHQAHER